MDFLYPCLVNPTNLPNSYSGEKIDSIQSFDGSTAQCNLDLYNSVYDENLMPYIKGLLQRLDKRISSLIDHEDIRQESQILLIKYTFPPQLLQNRPLIISVFKRIAKQRVIQFYRKHVNQSRNFKKQVSADYDLVPSGKNFQNFIIARDFYHHSSQTLSPEEIQLINLRLSGYSWKEISLIMMKNPDACRMCFERLIKSLQAKYCQGDS